MIAGELAALLRRAQEHLAQGRLAEAEHAYLEAVAVRADIAEVHFNLGIVRHGLGRFAPAIESHQRALELKPQFPEAHGSIGSAFAALGRWDEASAAFERALAQRPAYADAHSNLGLIHEERGRLDEARASFERALAIDPRHGEAIHNLGFLLDAAGRTDEAMALYRRALEADPRMARAAYSLGLAHLRRHEFAQGWELAEARFDTVPPMTPRRALALPQLTAAELGRGHRVAIWPEQGVGDQLVHATLLPELEARGQDFVIEVDARLAAAFRRAHPRWSVVTAAESAAAFASCDRQIAAGSLARWLRPSLASFAAQPRALLAADTPRARQYRDRLGEGPAAGISWRSFQARTRARVARDKSAPLAAFGRLARTHRLLDLQYGDTAAERAAFAQRGGQIEHFDDLDLFNDLDGVLAAIEACDVVVSTSSVTAHLAGALGKRTLLVHLGPPPFHYWAAGSDGRSLWYPSVEVVPGAGLESWEQALERADGLLGR